MKSKTVKMVLIWCTLLLVVGCKEEPVVERSGEIVEYVAVPSRGLRNYVEETAADMLAEELLFLSSRRVIGLDTVEVVKVHDVLVEEYVWAHNGERFVVDSTWMPYDPGEPWWSYGRRVAIDERIRWVPKTVPIYRRIVPGLTPEQDSVLLEILNERLTRASGD